MSLLARRRAMMGAKPAFPPEYQQVEWIETDGASRIDTGVAFDGTKDFVLTLEAEMNTTILYPGGENVMTGWNAGGAIGLLYRDNTWWWTDGASAPTAGTHLTGGDELTTCEMTIKAGTETNTITVFANENGTKTMTRGHSNVANRTFLNTFPLFAKSTQNSFEFTPNGFRIKSAAIKQGGVTLRNMYACYRKSDNVLGFYDMITGTFSTNLGTGTFKKGADVI